MTEIKTTRNEIFIKANNVDPDHNTVERVDEKDSTNIKFRDYQGNVLFEVKTQESPSELEQKVVTHSGHFHKIHIEQPITIKKPVIIEFQTIDGEVQRIEVEENEIKKEPNEELLEKLIRTTLLTSIELAKDGVFANELNTTVSALEKLVQLSDTYIL